MHGVSRTREVELVKDALAMRLISLLAPKRHLAGAIELHEHAPFGNNTIAPRL